MIGKELSGVTTNLIFVPSHRDIHHIDPLPQHPFHPSYFSSLSQTVTLAPNPSVLQLNDVRFGLVNCDVLKEMCQILCPKNMDQPKIDLGLMGILQ